MLWFGFCRCWWVGDGEFGLVGAVAVGLVVAGEFGFCQVGGVVAVVVNVDVLGLVDVVADGWCPRMVSVDCLIWSS